MRAPVLIQKGRMAKEEQIEMDGTVVDTIETHSMCSKPAKYKMKWMDIAPKSGFQGG